MGVTVVRDQFGVPHIFADTLNGALMAQGYAQAQDRLAAIWRNYTLALGQMAAVEGEQWLEDDFRKHLIGIPQKAAHLAAQLSTPVRAALTAFADGINRFMQEHPEKVPAGAEPVTPKHIVALMLWMTLQWSYAQVLHELEQAQQLLLSGEWTPPVSFTSNSWAVAPSRSALNAPIRLIDPHVPWFGEYRWHECHLHAAFVPTPLTLCPTSLSCAGFSIAGLPLIALGFNERVSWSATAGGPDTADAFLLRLSGDRKRYRYDGEWWDIVEETVPLKVKVGETVTEERRRVRRTHLGVIVFEWGDVAVALKSAYDDMGEEAFLQLVRMATAPTLDAFLEALSLFAFPPQNIIVATADGDIFYLLNGRTPRRNPQFDWRLPVPGWTKATEWQGILRWHELPHLRNPRSGFLQNCNNSPQFVTIGADSSSLHPDHFPPFAYYSHTGDVYRARCERALELLSQTPRLTVDDALRIAVDTYSPKANEWVQRLLQACEGASAQMLEQMGVREGTWQAALKALQRWDGRMDKDSVAAGVYLLWRWQYYQRHPELTWADDDKVPQSAAEQRDAVDAFCAALHHAVSYFGALPKLGEVQRLRRSVHSPSQVLSPLACDLPLSGVQSFAADCLRAIWAGGPGEDGRFHGVGGQSCTTIVVHTTPPQAWSITPFGVSDDPDSPHFVDQAALFSAEQFKPMTVHLSPR
ncbi:Glutaryl-7-aminocephalosporanic-acid acylase [bacterium HR17]|uniref:Glutaryl-7-aminocephalosporanic-acid acylase n=1 Tax=Candidatus Fervidibacter japonicus TaxID=2035412 RepID=A0A2H5XFK4_9BACT|nr:Glutaryl-7-aminocephalosporanic-acid acylase [bacterium HR17]